MRRSIAARSETWNRKRISTMPSRCVLVVQESTLVPVSENTRVTSSRRLVRSIPSMYTST